MAIPAASHANLAVFLATLRALKQGAEVHGSLLASREESVERVLEMRRELFGQKTRLLSLYQDTPNMLAMIQAAFGSGLNVKQELTAISAAIDNVVTAINAIVPFHQANGVIYPLVVTTTADGSDGQVTISIAATATLRQRLAELAVLID